MYETLRVIIGRNVKARREELGMSCNEVAKACGMSNDTIRHIEDGESNFRAKTLEAIAEVLGLSFADLFKE